MFISQSEMDIDLIHAHTESRIRILEARAKLHPITQIIYAFYDGIAGVQWVGLFFIFFIGVLAVYALLPALEVLAASPIFGRK